MPVHDRVSVVETMPTPAPDPVIEVVLELLETEGYDAVQLRQVARRARVSLTTIYKRYVNRDELIATAIEQWMQDNRYAHLQAPPPEASVYEGLLQIHRTIFEPFERHPRMLQAYHRARTSPSGARLVVQGQQAVTPLIRGVLADSDPQLLSDIRLILPNVVYALLGRFADGEIPITEILSTIERTLFMLTVGAEELAAAS